VVVERRRLDGDERPALGDGRLWLLADRESAERVVGIDLGGEHCEHRRIMPNRGGGRRLLATDEIPVNIWSQQT
jgi:hypothetical protein